MVVVEEAEVVSTTLEVVVCLGDVGVLLKVSREGSNFNEITMTRIGIQLNLKIQEKLIVLPKMIQELQSQMLVSRCYARWEWGFYAPSFFFHLILWLLRAS